MKRIIFLLVTGLLIIPSVLWAQQPADTFTVEGIMVIRKPTVKQIINVSVYYIGGVTNYPADEAGIENLALAGTTDCGTRSYTKDEFKNMADTYGIHIYGSSNYDYGKISLNCISKYFDKGWNLLAEAVNHPVYNENDFKLLKQKIIARIKNQAANPSSKIQKMAIETTFKGTAYATDPLGELNTVNQLSASDVKSYYYNTLLNKNRMFIVVVGKLSKAVISQKIGEAFGSLPEKPYASPSYEVPVIASNSLYIEPRKLSTNYIAGIANAPAFTADDFVANQLAIAALSDNFFEEIRTKRNLSYAPYAYSVRRKMPYSYLFVSTPKPKAAVGVMMDEIRRLRTKGFSQKEFTEMRDLFITRNYMRQQSTDAMAANLGISKILGDWKMPQEFIGKVRQTTPDELTNAFRKYVKGINWNYLGNTAAVDSAKAVFKTSVQSQEILK